VPRGDWPYYRDIVSLGLRSFISGLFEAGPRAAAALGRGNAERRRNERVPVDREVRLEWREGDSWRVEPVETVDSSAAGLGVLTESPLEVGGTIYVLDADQPAVQAHVCSCEKVGDSYRVGLAVIRRERRRMSRTAAGGHAHVRWTGKDGKTLEAEAHVRNASDGGLQLTLQQAAEEGSVLRLTGDQIECMGTVRYSIPHGKEHLVGVELLGEAFDVARDE